MVKIYYHITTKENAKSILKNGLKPKIGDNSKVMEENTPAVYLCKRKDIPYWKVLLGCDVVLRIVVKDDSDFAAYHYTDYDEWLCFVPIPADCISVVDVHHAPKTMVSVMTKLVFTSIHGISRLCEVCARYYCGNGMYDACKADLYDEIRHSVPMEELVLSRLDMSIVPNQSIRDYLQKLGNGGSYTMCDTYMNENKRLYEKLSEYDNDDLYEARLKMYGLITSKFSGCLDVGTGGWTG